MKGFVLTVRLETGEKYIKSFSKVSQAIYETRRYYNHTPHLVQTTISIHDVYLYTYTKATEREIINMSVYAKYRDQNPNFDKIPYMDAADRATFAKAGIPFRIGKYRLVDGTYGKQIVCDVKVKTDHPAWQAIYGSADVQGEYQLSFTGTQGRVNQFEQLVSQDIEAQRLLVLVSVGKSYDLDRYVPNPREVTSGSSE